jgi:hypothetical protein
LMRLYSVFIIFCHPLLNFHPLFCIELVYGSITLTLSSASFCSKKFLLHWPKIIDDLESVLILFLLSPSSLNFHSIFHTLLAPGSILALTLTLSKHHMLIFLPLCFFAAHRFIFLFHHGRCGIIDKED